MKAFRGTLFSTLIRIANKLEDGEDRREALALNKVKTAKGGKAVDEARKALAWVRRGRKDRILSKFMHEAEKALAHHRLISEREMGGDTSAKTIQAWTDVERMHLISTLFM